MANHNLPTISSLYTEYTQSLKDRHDDALRQLDPAYTEPTNVPANSVRFSSAAGKWQRWDGANWVDLASSYAINVSGNAATATKLATARTIGGVSFDGSANINLPGVNAAGNQNTTGNAATATTAATCTGNAATATALQTARTINGVSFNGTSNIQTSEFLHSLRDFVNGTLITTNIDYSVTNGDPFILEIRGNSYGNLVPIDFQYQGYIYNNTILNHGGLSTGYTLTGLVALNVSGNLCFWFPRQSYWEGYNVKVYSALEGRAVNRVTSIIDSAKPSGTKEVAFSNIVKSARSDGTNATGTWPINISGSAGNGGVTSVNGATGAVTVAGGVNGAIYTSGSGTFTVPAGVTSLRVTLVGGGGGGNTGGNYGGGGGGGGGIRYGWLSVTPGQGIPYIVGGGGGQGGGGGTSQVSAGSTIQAYGGGPGGIDGGGGGSGGSGTGGYGGSGSGGGGGYWAGVGAGGAGGGGLDYGRGGNGAGSWGPANSGTGGVVIFEW